MIRGGTGENARLREQRKAQEAQNDAELLAYTNELLAKEMVRGDLHGTRDEWPERQPMEPGGRGRPRADRPVPPTYRPDETDDQWATKWEDDFDRSREEWERFA